MINLANQLLEEPIMLDATGQALVNAVNGISAALNVKGLKDILDSVGISHNGIYRGKNFGTITSANIGAFLSEHKVAEGLFTDLYVGDCFTIQDGTYNKTWEIVGFDCYLNKGDTAFTKHHLALMPRNNLLNIGMNATDVTTDGYVGSRMYKETIPTIVTNLTKALGDRLLTRKALLTKTVNTTLASAMGAGRTGCSTDWGWYDVKACLPSEVAIYGATVFSSSFYDVGEDCERLPIFQFKNHVHSSRESFWLRAVAYSTAFAFADYNGVASNNNASYSGVGVRPLICVG